MSSLWYINQQLILQNAIAADGGVNSLSLSIAAVSSVSNVVSMRITFSDAVIGFLVGDITISAGGSLANFATADNIVFTVDWTLAAGANTMDIAAGVCKSAAGLDNPAATQFSVGYTTIQPNAAAGLDTFINSAGATGNNGLATSFSVGERAGTTGVMRGLIKFDLSSLIGRTLVGATLGLYETSAEESNARTMRVYRQKRVWVEGTGSVGSGASWNTYDGSNNWQTAGGFGANDCEQTDIGSVDLPTPDADGWKTINLTPSAVQAMIDGIFTNNGFLLKMDTETDDKRAFTSSDHATASLHPKLEAVYYPFDFSALTGADVFIIAGESNASGRGTNNQTFTQTGTYTSYLLANNYQYTEMADPTDNASGQVDTVSVEPNAPAAGSVWPLVATALSAESRKTVFIPCALGGSGIADWQPGTDHQDRTTLYGSMVYRALQAKAGGGTLKAVLAWIGTNDCGSLSQAQFNTYLDAFANAVQTDLGIKVMIGKLQNSTDRDETDIDAAIVEAQGDNANVLTGPDLSGLTADDNIYDGVTYHVHLCTDQNLAAAGTLWANAIIAAFGY